MSEETVQAINVKLNLWNVTFEVNLERVEGPELNLGTSAQEIISGSEAIHTFEIPEVFSLPVGQGDV